MRKTLPFTENIYMYIICVLVTTQPIFLLLNLIDSTYCKYPGMFHDFPTNTYTIN